MFSEGQTQSWKSGIDKSWMAMAVHVCQQRLKQKQKQKQPTQTTLILKKKKQKPNTKNDKTINVLTASTMATTDHRIMTGQGIFTLIFEALPVLLVVW